MKRLIIGATFSTKGWRVDYMVMHCKFFPCKAALLLSCHVFQREHGRTIRLMPLAGNIDERRVLRVAFSPLPGYGIRELNFLQVRRM